MNKTWINRSNNDSLVLFFNGWGMDEHAVNHLKTDGFDVLMLNDYSQLILEEELVYEYRNLFVVAWSLGVWAATNVLSGCQWNISKAIAINGTQKPIDSEYGIAPHVFQATLNNWDEKNRKRFNARMFGGMKSMLQYSNCLPCREMVNQNDELTFLQTGIMKQEPVKFKFDVAVIGNNDMIFFADNQQKFWQEKAKIINSDLPHFPFIEFESWEQILGL